VTSFASLRQRVLAILGAVSMYRLALYGLGLLGLVALVLSLFDLVSPDPIELIASYVVLAAVISAVDAAAQRLLHLPWRVESSLVTALVLLFVMQPGASGPALLGLALAGALASLSKYLIAWRGRHIFNPAAFGAAVVSIVGAFGAFEWLGTSASWWVGTAAMAGPVALVGLAILWRVEKIRVVVLFLLIAVGASVVRQAVETAQFGGELELSAAVFHAAVQSPFLFLGIFMVAEPLTSPPRRWQQFWVAGVVGVLAGWPIVIGGLFTLGQERAMLIGNLLALTFALRGSVRLVLEKREFITPTAQELTFRTRGSLRFLPGQYLELDVPHHRPDARGTRREFSIVSAPADLPVLRIAYKNGDQKHPSSYKRGCPCAHGRRGHRRHAVRFAAAPAPGRWHLARRGARLCGIRCLGTGFPCGARVDRRADHRLHQGPTAGPAPALDVGAGDPPRRRGSRAGRLRHLRPARVHLGPTSAARRSRPRVAEDALGDHRRFRRLLTDDRRQRVVSRRRMLRAQGTGP
jgi:hypothetical protein